MTNILKNITLLYAEDDLEVQKQMLEYFESFFKKIYVASQGKEALELYKEHKPELMIVDIFMPKLDGLSLTEAIRKDDLKTKIVVLSAHSQTEMLLKAINLKVDYYLLKPASILKIKEMLNKISEEFLRDVKYIIPLDSDTYYDKNLKTLISNKIPIKLSNKESKILELLVENIGQSVSIHDIGNFVWSDSIDLVSNESIKMQISNLRKKLPKDLVTSIYGVGYTLKI